MDDSPDLQPIAARQARALLDRHRLAAGVQVRHQPERLTAAPAMAPFPDPDEDDFDPSHEGGLDHEFLTDRDETSDPEDDALEDPSHEGGLDPDWR